MKLKKIKRLLYPILAVAVWLILWECLARLVDLSFALPSVSATALALGKLLLTGKFYLTVLSSLGRIALGFVIGVFLGMIAAALTLFSDLLRSVISPMMTVIKSTPVASFIMILWILLGGESVPIAIAVLMVMPIVWQSLLDGYRALDPALSEVLVLYRVPFIKRLRIFILPSLVRYLLPAVVTSFGLSWKAGIAAEIIAYTTNSIGKEIANAKNFFYGAEMYAWTLTVILLSLLFEKIIRFLGERVRRYGETI